MAQDDWRIRIELPDEEGARGFLDRLGVTKGDAEELADRARERGLSGCAARRQRLGGAGGGHPFFVSAAPGRQAEEGSRVVEQELQEEGLAPKRFVTERWLHDEERWDDEPDAGDVEEDLLRRGYAPWEVRVECESLGEADKLADQLRSEGFDFSRTFTFVI